MATGPEGKYTEPGIFRINATVALVYQRGMGSFDYRCSISGLPISSGDAVRYIVLQQNPFHAPGVPTCYTNDWWKPRSFPVKARYNDYGLPENLKDSAEKDVLFASFKTDAVERGVGDNSYHENEVKRDMDEEAWLDAIRQGRVKIRDKEPLLRHGKPVKIPEGIPTRKRIEKCLTDAGIKLSVGGGDTGCMVSRVRRGFVRVRAEGYSGERALLKKAKAALDKHYAVMEMVGTKSYADPRELLVAPGPSEKQSKPGVGETRTPLGYFLESPAKRKPWDRPMVVCQAMVREDVWQALLQGGLESWSSSKKITLENLYDEAVAYYKLRLERAKKSKEMLLKRAALIAEKPGNPEEAIKQQRALELDLLLLEHEGVRDRDMKGTFVPWITSRSEGNGGPGYGLRDAFAAAVDMNLKGRKRAEFLKTCAQTIFVSWRLSGLGFQWRAGTSCGPQFSGIGEWTEQKEYLESLIKICDKEIAEQKANQEDDE